jgi:FtsP/CotA-like multicopper oxidase with cupredoxin domain
MTALFGARKRLLAICTSVLALSLFTLISTRVSGPALAESDGSAYTVPLVDDVNPDPDIVETTIVAQAAGVDINTGGDVSVLTFNGTIPGPEFRLKVGDTVIVHFRNEIAHATGIHWHGIELHNAHDGTPLTQNMVAPGDTWRLLVSPAPSLVDQPGLQGHVRIVHRHRLRRGLVAGDGAAVGRGHQDNGAQRLDGL